MDTRELLLGAIRRSARGRPLFVALALTLGLALAGCGGGEKYPEVTGPAKTVTVAKGWTVKQDLDVKGEVRIAHGFGATYGPLIAVRQLKAFNKMYPNVHVKWFDLASTSDQRDAMLSGSLDFGSCSPLPLLTAWDAGVNWKVVTPIAETDIYFTARPDGPDRVDDLVGTQLGIGPAPKGAQDYIVRKYLADEGEDPSALDSNWVNLPHPDAMSALKSGQLAIHGATSEYALEEVRRGNKTVLKASDVLDGLYGVCAVVMDDFAKEHRDVTRAFQVVLDRTVQWARKNPEAYAASLSESTDGEVPVSDFIALQKEKITMPTTKHLGIKNFAEILTDLGVIDRKYSGPEDFYVYPDEAPEQW